MINKYGDELEAKIDKFVKVYRELGTHFYVSYTIGWLKNTLVMKYQYKIQPTVSYLSFRLSRII